MRLHLLWEFIKWTFVKLFGSLLDTAVEFRTELKRGAPNSVFASFAFVAASVVLFGVIALLSVTLIASREVVNYIICTVFWTLVAAYFYNVIKAGWECFVDERQELIDVLKESK
jgi:hypothetical protein